MKVIITGSKADIAGTFLYGGDITKCSLFRSNVIYGMESFEKHLTIQHRLVRQSYHQSLLMSASVMTTTQ